MEKVNSDNKNDKKYHKLNKIERQEKQENGNVNENNNNISSSMNFCEENNQEEIKSKLLKILFGDKNKNKKEEENNNQKTETEKLKTQYETNFDFQKTRLPKIKFRLNKEKRNANNNVNNEKKNYNTEIKHNIVDMEKINGGFNENLNTNKEKKKIKKVVKKKVKKKKKIKKDEKINENYESAAERGVDDEVETSVQEERLSKSLQERKLDKKRMTYLKEDEKKEKIKEEEKEKIKDKNKEKIKEEDNIKDIKENNIKSGKKEIIEKLIKYSGKKVLEDNLYSQKRTDLNLSNNKDKDNDNNNNIINGKKEEKKQENKSNSLIKREQTINARLINNSSLNHKERIRRKQLEKDLEAEINKDELSDDPFDESENETNNKEEDGFRSLSARTRKIAKKIDQNIIDQKESNHLYDSIIKRQKAPNYKNFKKYKQFTKDIYTPKKAVLSRENSKTNNFVSNKERLKKLVKNDNDFNTMFDPKEKEKATKFKMFNDNCKIRKMNEINNINNSNALDFNQLSSIDLPSYINNSNTIDYNNGNNKMLYIKKSPGRTNIPYNNNNQNLDRNRANTLNAFSMVNNIRQNNYGNNYDKKNVKNMLINRFKNRNNTDASFPEQNYSEEDNDDDDYGLLNDSNEEKMSNTFYINTGNAFNIKKNIQEKARNANNNSFTFRKHVKILNPLPSFEMNLEDLFLIENKYFHIIHNLGEKKEIANDCFDLFNFYYNCSFYQSLLNIFTEPNIIKLNINYTLMSLLISYDLSYKRDNIKKIYLLLLEMFIINYKNIMLIAEYITNKVNNDSDNIIWINKLKNKIIKYKESQEGEDIDSYNNFGLTINEKIKYNSHYLMQKIHYILLNYEENNNNTLLFFLKTINSNSYDKINIFFNENIIRDNYGFNSVLASSLIKNNSISNKINQPEVPYISFPSIKKYSLILDLDETLIYLDKIRNENNGTLKIRPGTFLFLEKIKKYFEIIIFSEAEQNYVDLIINSLEENGKYFDYILYRQHTTIKNEEFIKDLDKIGRKLSNVIIVDNMPQNFRLQNENGIYIKPFWGTDNDDDVLFYLGKVLIQIASEGGDLRKGLKKYRKEIIINISTSYRDN